MCPSGPRARPPRRMVGFGCNVFSLQETKEAVACPYPAAASHFDMDRAIYLLCGQKLVVGTCSSNGFHFEIFLREGETSVWVADAKQFSELRYRTGHPGIYFACLPWSWQRATRSDMFASPTHMTVSAAPQ